MGAVVLRKVAVPSAWRCFLCALLSTFDGEVRLRELLHPNVPNVPLIVAFSLKSASADLQNHGMIPDVPLLQVWPWRHKDGPTFQHPEPTDGFAVTPAVANSSPDTFPKQILQL